MKYPSITLSSGLASIKNYFLKWTFSLTQNCIFCSTEIYTVAHKFYFNHLAKNSYILNFNNNKSGFVLFEGKPGQRKLSISLFNKQLIFFTVFSLKIKLSNKEPNKVSLGK